MYLTIDSMKMQAFFEFLFTNIDIPLYYFPPLLPQETKTLFTQSDNFIFYRGVIL